MNNVEAAIDLGILWKSDKYLKYNDVEGTPLVYYMEGWDISKILHSELLIESVGPRQEFVFCSHTYMPDGLVIEQTTGYLLLMRLGMK